MDDATKKELMRRVGLINEELRELAVYIGQFHSMGDERFVEWLQKFDWANSGKRRKTTKKSV